MKDNLDLNPVKQISILEVANRLGIEVKGKKALCFKGHDKKSLSLTFDPSKNLWHCFGCGMGGDSISLVQEFSRTDFIGALDWFAQIFHVDVRNRNRRVCPKKAKPISSCSNLASVQQTPQSCEFVADQELYQWFVDRCTGVTSEVGITYLKTHGIPRSVADKLGVKELRNPDRAFECLKEKWGAARVYRSGMALGKEKKPDRLVWTSYCLLFPFYDGPKVVYLQGRMFQGNIKYLNLRGIQKPIYNVNVLKRLGAGKVVHICEGIPDALAMCAKDLAAVAVLGASSFRPEWVDLFLRYEVVLLPDGDQGGETLRRKIVNEFKQRGKAITSLKMPNGKDVADVIGENV